MKTTIQVQGTNRGGTEFLRQILPAVHGHEAAMQMDAWDLLGERAERFSDAVRLQGINARWGIGAPPDNPGVGFKGTFIDDPGEIARELERASLAKVHGTGILAESRLVPGLGGAVAGFGTIRTPDSPEVDGQARQLFGAIAEAAGEGRTTSRAISTLPANSRQLDFVRRRAHSVFADNAAGVVKGLTPVPQLFTVTRRAGHAYPSVVVEAPTTMSRRACRRAALSEILPHVGGDERHFGVTYVRPDEPSLYTVLASQRGSNWYQDQVIELPVEMPERKSFVVPAPQPVPSTPVPMQTPASPQRRGFVSTIARGARLLVTD